MISEFVLDIATSRWLYNDQYNKRHIDKPFTFDGLVAMLLTIVMLATNIDVPPYPEYI